MTKPKAINREKLVAFVLSIIAKGVDLMPNEKLEKLKHEQYVAERKLTAAKHKEKRLESEIKRLTRSERTRYTIQLSSICLSGKSDRKPLESDSNGCRKCQGKISEIDDQ